MLYNPNVELESRSSTNTSYSDRAKINLHRMSIENNNKNKQNIVN